MSRHANVSAMVLKERTHIARCTFALSGATSLLYGSSQRSHACTSDVRATCFHTSSHRSETRRTCRQSAPPAPQTCTWGVGAPGCCGSREGSGGGAAGPDNSGGGAAAAEVWEPGGRGMCGLRLSHVGRWSLHPRPAQPHACSRAFARVSPCRVRISTPGTHQSATPTGRPMATPTAGRAGAAHDAGGGHASHGPASFPEEQRQRHSGEKPGRE